MSAFHNAFEAFLATPGSASPKEAAGGETTPGEESPRPPPAARRGRGGGVVVKAPSPEVEIPTTAIRKSSRRRRRKKLDSESSSSRESESEDVLILDEEEEEEVMPSRRSSRESVLARRSRKEAAADSPAPASRTQPRRANGSAVPTRRAAAATGLTQGTDDGTVDLWTETACRLCDRRDFAAETDSLAEHYVTAHYRSKLEAEAGGGSRTTSSTTAEFPCALCRAKRPRCAAFGSRRLLAVHLGVVHGRAAALLAAKLDLKVGDSRPPATTTTQSKSGGEKGGSSSGGGGGKPAVQTKASQRSQRGGSSDTRTTKKAAATNRSGGDSSPEVIELDDEDENSRQSDDKDEEEEEEDSEGGKREVKVRKDTREEEEENGGESEEEENKPSEEEEEKAAGVEKLPSGKEIKGPWQCQLCQAKVPTRTAMKRHGIDKHFYKTLQEEGGVPNRKPFVCSQTGCTYEGDSAQSVTRHFGIKHRGIDPYLARLMGKQADELTRSPGSRSAVAAAANTNRRTTTTSGVSVEGGETKKKELWVVLNRKAAGDRAASRAAADLLAATGGKVKAKSEAWVVSNSAGGRSAANNKGTADNNEEEGSSSGGEVDSDANDDDEGDDDDDGDDESNGAGDKKGPATETTAAAVSSGGGGRKPPHPKKKNRTRGEKSTMEEFQQALRDNLRTKDGAYCTAKDDSSVICVCGKVIRICNAFYWKYLVQKPRVVNGKLYARGHWYVCEEVKRRGSEYQLSAEEKAEIRRELELCQQNKGLKRNESADREEPTEIKKMKTRRRGVVSAGAHENGDWVLDGDEEDDEEEEDKSGPADEEAAAVARQQVLVQRTLQDMVRSRRVGETFLQDGPCYQVAAELALCRECKAVSFAERDELILKGKFTEESSNITCSFYAFRKLRLTRNNYLMVDGYLDPVKDPTPTDIALWTPDKTRPPADVDLAKIKYILGLIGDQFCTMVQQERKCFSLHMGPNKSVTWKRPVRGVREMCDVCKTTLFNHHWICGMCGMFVCLDCYQFRRGGLVKDKTVADRSTDDYKWPYCTTGSQHHINNLMLAAIIPRQCLVDLAKKVHQLRVRWQIPQFCHQSDEIKGLFAQDDGFLGLQPTTLNVVNPSRHVFFPCQLCSNESFRWQFDLYKHYATQHFAEELMNMMNHGGGSLAGPPFKCPWPSCTLALDTEQQILIHYGLNHKAVLKILESRKLANNEIVAKVPGIRSNMLALPSAYKCPICDATLPAKHRADHLTVHFKDKMSPLLAKEIPFTCPKCRYVALDRTSLIRHFATKHGLVDAFLKDWLERHGRKSEAAAIPAIVPPKIRPLDPAVPECRLCEEFPTFSKPFEFHKHLAEIHFRMELNNELPQNNVAPFQCPVESCAYETKVRSTLLPHYGVNHQSVFRHYNRITGNQPETSINITRPGGPMGP